VTIWIIAAALAFASRVAGGAGSWFSDDSKLLPPEQAFRLSAQAVDPRTVVVRFDVEDGYYLYRDKLAFAIEPASLASGKSPVLPDGTHKHDSFFGDVEIYRGQIAALITLAGPASGRAIVVKTQSQGCADAGVCYPLTSQALTVPVPQPGTGPGPVVEAPHSRKPFFQ